MSADVAVAPAYRTGPEYARTLGPEVADLAELANYAPDPEQREGLNDLFGLNKNGKSACFEYCVICARQNLKTGELKMAALGWLFITEEKLIVWSAHEFSTTREAHRDMVELIDGCSWLSRRVKNIYDSSNDKSIHLKSGARLVFKARTHSGGRGLSGNKVILDEAFALKSTHMGSLVPTLSVQPDPQLVYASSACLSNSDVLRGVRDRGRAGVSPRLAYCEFCAPTGGCLLDPCDHAVGNPGCALDKVENLAAANPLLGRTRANGTGLTLEYLQSERQALTPAEFARERLGWHDDPGAAEVFGAGKWEACAGPTPRGAVLQVVGVAVSHDLASAAVVGAGRVDGRTFVQVLAHGPGVDWVPEHCPRGVRVILDPKGPAAAAVPGLKAASVWRKDLASVQVFDAFDDFYTAVVDGVVLHDSDPILTKAANSAVPREVGDRKTWARRKVSSEITAVEAATLALSWVHRLPPDDDAPPLLPMQASYTAPTDDAATAGF